MVREEEQATLTAAVASLPSRARAVVALRYGERLTYAEIGARLAITPKTAENHMARALRRLRTLLTRQRASDREP